MEFGKLENVDAVRFLLPEPTPRGLALLRRERERKSSLHMLRPQTVRIGAPTWTSKSWLGRVYPPGLKATDALKVYSRQFHCIELCSTFYGTPSKTQVDRWRESTPTSFRFCPKVPEKISHCLDISTAIEPALEFFERMRGLGERLGLIFLQLPQGFDLWQADQLEKFLEYVPSDIKLAIEFRHASWFDRKALRQAATQLFELKQIATVITDTAGHRELVHGTLTAPRVLVRFLGNNLHPSDYTRLDAWVRTIKQWLENGIEEIDFMIHQPEQHHTPELIRVFTEKLNRETELDLWHWAPASALFSEGKSLPDWLRAQDSQEISQSQFNF